MKTILSLMPSLVPCDDEECMGECEMWHQGSQCDIKDPVLGAWGKQWLTEAFAFTNPMQASLFTIQLRLPLCLQQQLQMYSGNDGLYLEPRSEDGRSPSEAFQIVWCPGFELNRLQMLKRTMSKVQGLARVGSKLGLRTKSADAQEVHSIVRPDAVYLPQGKKKVWMIGPFPWGAVKASITKALADSGWVARPLHALHSMREVEGTMFKAQSVEDPPSSTLKLAHGDIMVTRLDDDRPPKQESLQVLGNSKTKEIVSTVSAIDTLQIQDPWAKKQPVLSTIGTKSVPMHDHLGELETKITAAVLNQLGTSREMEVDGDSTMQARVAELETRLDQVATKQEQLQDAVTRQGVDTNVQIQQLQGVMQAQNDQLEKAFTKNHTLLQEQLLDQSKKQEVMLNSMFRDQMQQFESLTSKQGRTASGPY